MLKIDINQKLKEKYPLENLKCDNYINAKSPCDITCLTCNTVYHFSHAENAYNRQNKKVLCNICFNNNTGNNYTAIQFQQKINEHFPNESIQIYNFNGVKNPIIAICNNCGYRYDYTKAENLLYKTNSFCKNCIPNKNYIIKQKRQDFVSYLLTSNFILLDNIDKKHSQDLVRCECKYCGKINKKTMNAYLKGINCSCLANNTKKTLEDYQNELEDGYTILEYNGMNNYSLFRHDCGFIYKAKTKNHKCPKCLKSKSLGEETILKFLQVNSINYEREYQIQIENHNLRFDFYLPEYNMFIEYQGIQHYQPVKFFGGETRFKTQQYYDKLKEKYCKQTQSQLLIINYLDLKNNNIDNILSKTFKVQRPSQ